MWSYICCTEKQILVELFLKKKMTNTPILICKAIWLIQIKTNEQIKITAKEGPWFLTTAYLWLSFQKRRLGERRLHSHVISST